MAAGAVCATSAPHKIKSCTSVNTPIFFITIAPYLSDSVVQPFDHLHAPAQDLFIGHGLSVPSVSNAIAYQRLSPAKMFIGQVGIMNRLRHQHDPLVFDGEALYQSFKSAVVAHVTEAAGVEHIERNCFGMAPRVFIKNELCLRIDVAQYQPGGRNAVNPRMRTGDPHAAGVVFGVLLAMSVFCGDAVAFELLHGLLDSSPQRSSEEINFNDLLQASFQAQEARFRPRTVWRLCQLLQLLFEQFVFTGPRLIEHLLELLVSELVERAHLRDRRMAL